MLCYIYILHHVNVLLLYHYSPIDFRKIAEFLYMHDDSNITYKLYTTRYSKCMFLNLDSLVGALCTRIHKTIQNSEYCA